MRYIRAITLAIIVALFGNCASSHKSIAEYKYDIEDVKSATDQVINKTGFKISYSGIISNNNSGYIYRKKCKILDLKFKPQDSLTHVEIIGVSKRINQVMDSFLAQELNKDIHQSNLTKKSYLTFNLLNILNPGVGEAYSLYRYPYVKKNTYLISLIVGIISDPLYIYAFGTDLFREPFDPSNGLAIFWFTFNRAFCMLNNYKISYHNKVVAAGYKVQF